MRKTTVCGLCGGTMVFSHTDKSGRIPKHYYKCQKCGFVANIITWSSYDELVLSGQIRVSKEKYRYIKEKYRR